METTFTKWDVADHLKTQEDIAAYIAAAAEEGTPDALPDAFSDVFRAQGKMNEAAACASLAAYIRATAHPSPRTARSKTKAAQSKSKAT